MRNPIDPSPAVATTWSRARQVVYWGVALLVLVWAQIDPRFRDAEGFRRGLFCLPISAGAALIVLGCAAGSRLQQSAIWLALAIVGQAAALQMIDAGPFIRYQHYRPLQSLLETSTWLLLYLGIQTVLVAAGLRSHWPAISAWVNRNLRAWQILGVGLVCLGTSATVSRDPAVYLIELPFAAFILAVNLGNIVLAVCALPDVVAVRWRSRIDRFLGGTEAAGPDRVDRFAITAALWVVAASALLSFFSYERHPHIPDEVGYLYHARYLAAGMLTMPAPPVPEAFDVDLMTYEANRWYCPMPPGWPLPLALGILLGVPWLINPLLAGLNILLAYVLARELYDLRTARLTTLLLCASPWHVFMAMNFMTHTFTFTCLLVAALTVVWARRTGWVGWAALSGAAVGFMTLIRPLEGAVVGGLIGLWTLGLGGRRLKVSGISAFVFGCIAVTAINLPYNKLLTGSPTVFPVMAYFDRYYGPNSNAMGFGPERGVGWPIDPYPGHGFRDVIVNTNLNTFSINIELFGWATGSLLFIALLVFAGAARGPDYLMLAAIAATLIAHLFYWFSGGPDFGARYWYLMLLPCVVLTARGIQFLADKPTAAGSGAAGQTGRVLIGVFLLCAMALVNYFPWRAIDKYHHYLRMRPDIRSLARQYGFGRSLVLIRGDRHPDYASAATYNPLDLRANAPIYAWDRNPEVRAQVLQAYSDRQVWIIDGPSRTAAGFKVTAGPLSPDQALRELSQQSPAR